jgi:hypothetical protein
MRVRSLVIILSCLLCAACVTKPAAKAPTSATPEATERKDAEPPAGEKPDPASTPNLRGDPCSGGEN